MTKARMKVHQSLRFTAALAKTAAYVLPEIEDPEELEHNLGLVPVRTTDPAIKAAIYHRIFLTGPAISSMKLDFKRDCPDSEWVRAKVASFVSSDEKIQADCVEQIVYLDPVSAEAIVVSVSPEDTSPLDASISIDCPGFIISEDVDSYRRGNVIGISHYASAELGPMLVPLNSRIDECSKDGACVDRVNLIRVDVKSLFYDISGYVESPTSNPYCQALEKLSSHDLAIPAANDEEAKISRFVCLRCGANFSIKKVL